MVKFLVKKAFINKDDGKKVKKDDVIDITVKRAEEINTNNKRKVIMLKRLDEKEGD